MEDRSESRRRFVRHPITVPLAVRPHGAHEPFLSRVGDLSEGGLSFFSAARFEAGATVDVELPVHHSRFTLTGTVAACIALPDGTFRIGLTFTETGLAFKLKLAEQVLRIEELRQTLSKERGALVTSREAAQVWVDQYASTFADLV
jgi:hypothetical protein